MSVVVKARLKAARDAIASKDWQSAKEHAADVLDADSKNYNAYVFLGLATQNLEEYSESEEAYKFALNLNAVLPLAWQGLSNLYEKEGKNDQLVDVYEQLIGIFNDNKDGKKLYETINKLSEIYERVGDTVKLCSNLASMAPGGRFYDCLKGIEEIQSPLTIWTTIADLQRSSDDKIIQKEIELRRKRLGADPLPILKKKVISEVLSLSQLATTYEHIMELIANDPDKLTSTQSEYLHHLQQKLASVEPSERKMLQQKLLPLARQLVDQFKPIPVAFEIVIETSDVDRPAGYEADLLNFYVANFPDRPLGEIIRGWISWQAREPFAESVDHYNAGFAKLPDSVFGHYTLCWLYYHSKEPALAREYAEQCKKLIKQNSIIMNVQMERMSESLDLCIADAYIMEDIKYASNALAMYKKIIDRNPDYIGGLLGIGKVYMLQQKFTEAEHAFKSVLTIDERHHAARAEIGWLKYLQNDYEGARGDLTSAIEFFEDGRDEDLCNYHIRLGRIFGALGDPDQSFTHLIAAAKICPTSSDAFTHLGHFYRESAKDRVRAKKCYQKAFSLNPRDSEAGIELSQYYIEDDEILIAEDLLRTVTEEDFQAGWAWKRLGFIVMMKNKWSETINCFQTSLRSNVKDVQCWEALAEAYLHEGRYMAAMKAFLRARELAPESIVVAYQIGCIQKTLGMYQESIEQFDVALDLLKNSKSDSDEAMFIPVLNSLSGTHISQAHDYILTGHYGRAAEHAGLALQCLKRAIDSNAQISCLWKAVGDGMLLYRRLPAFLHLAPRDTILRLAAIVHENDPDGKLRLTAGQEVKFSKPDESSADQQSGNCTLSMVLESASLAFKNVLLLSAQQKTLDVDETLWRQTYGSQWFDLSLTYYFRYRGPMAKKSSNAENGCLQSATKFIKIALKNDPGNPVFWNALGVYVSEEAPILSQHAFIRAIQAGKKSAVPWTNLGLLYLSRSDVELAYDAFTTAQTLDPEYTLAWMGKAFICELDLPNAASQNSRSSKESLELWTHCWELSLGSLTEVNFNFAMSSFAHVTANRSATIPVYDSETRFISPAFALQKLVEQRPGDVAARNLLGLLLERQGQHSQAAESFLLAYDELISGVDPQEEETSETLSIPAASILSNLARARCAAHDYSGAVEAFKLACRTASAIDDDPTVHLGFGLANYFAGDLEASLQEFELVLASAEQIALTTGEKSARPKHEVVMLLCAVLWALATDDARDMAKQQFFQCVSEDSEFLGAIFGLASMGMLQNDSALTTAAIDEVLKFSPHVIAEADRSKRVEQVLSAYFLSVDDPKQARAFLAKAIHAQPTLANLWIRLSRFLSHHCPERPFAASQTGASASALLDSHRSKTICSELDTSTTMASDSLECVAVAKLSSIDQVPAANAPERPADDPEHEAIDRENNVFDRAESAQRTASRAVFISPNRPSTWALLGQCAAAKNSRRQNQPEENARDKSVEKTISAVHEIFGHVVRMTVKSEEVSLVSNPYARLQQSQLHKWATSLRTRHPTPVS